MSVPRRLTTAWVAGLVLLSACAPAGDSPEPASDGPENGVFTAHLNGFDIRYEVRGQGPVLMTLPNSWGLTRQGVRALFEPLEQKLTLVYFDPRGMGESAPIREDGDMGLAAVRADFDALRRHLGLDRVNAVGWSNGASNLVVLAADYPETLDSAIFVHGLASFGEDDVPVMQERNPELFRAYGVFLEDMATVERPAEQQDELLKAFIVGTWTEHMIADAGGREVDLRTIYVDTGFSWRHSRFAEQEASTFDVRNRLADIAARCLVVAGGHDLLPVDKAEELHAGIPVAELAVFENSGHFAPLEEPAKFKRLVFEFLGVGESPGAP